ncbi:hypothetical protein [Actinoplanes sp. L3-i22]|uniref:hypothetical protein n=1 Tax=Actinoplanes sp. L3-i22 TaxID=2836373 RepID=UPI001C741B34|nr:hypothetical protein [Actinoplanes sp. L3-i22]BCY07270.1 hypothetical protein L3i22_023580 [Actinoplanes sp. L3-i22]
MNLLSQTLLTDSTTLVIIWMMLMVAALPAMMLLANPQSVHRPGQLAMAAVDLLRAHLEAREQARREAAAAVRFAGQAKIAAVRAEQALSHRQQLWHEAGQHTGDTWLSWQAAEQRVTRARTASAFTASPAAQAAVEFTDRERFLHRSVHAAVRRGDLPASALPAAMAARDGWNPRLHPVDQELALLRAVAEHRRHRHRQATAAEHSAWQNILQATATRDRLHTEALAAAHHAARHPLRPGRAHRTVPAPRPAWTHQPA